MARLRRVSPQMKGWTRRRAGKGFTYLDADGNRLPAEEVERIRSLAIPPAWRDVWICPTPTATSRRSAPTTRAAASTSTTPTGAPSATS